MEMFFGRAGRIERRGYNQDDYDSRRSAFSDASDQPAGCTLLLSRGADRFSGPALRRTQLEVADDTEKEFAGIQRRRRVWQEIAALKKRRFATESQRHRAKNLRDE